MRTSRGGGAQPRPKGRSGVPLGWRLTLSATGARSPAASFVHTASTTRGRKRRPLTCPSRLTTFLLRHCKFLEGSAIEGASVDAGRITLCGVAACCCSWQSALNAAEGAAWWIVAVIPTAPTLARGAEERCSGGKALGLWHGLRRVTGREFHSYEQQRKSRPEAIQAEITLAIVTIEAVDPLLIKFEVANKELAARAWKPPRCGGHRWIKLHVGVRDSGSLLGSGEVGVKARGY